MGKERDLSIDVAKGILIVMLIFHHIVDIGQGIHIDNEILRLMHHVQRPLVLCYFMQTFFMITGMCSSFEGSFMKFLWKQIRTLLIPGLAFSFAYHLLRKGFDANASVAFLDSYLKTGGPYWFITALFGGKVAYFWLRKLFPGKVMILVILTATSFIGTLLRTLHVMPNYYWHWQILDLTLFLAAGSIFKDLIRNDRYGRVSVVVYSVLAFAGILTYGARRVPYVTAGFGTVVSGWPLHVALALAGSVSILWFARKAAPCVWLQYLGRNSLIVYLTQGATLKFLLEGFSDVLSSGSPQTSIAAIMAIAISACAIAVVIAHVIDRTPLRILLGKSWALKTYS